MMRYGDYVVFISVILNASAMVLYAYQGHWAQAGYWLAALQLNFWIIWMK